MKITSAKWGAGELILTTSDPEAMRFAFTFQEGDYRIDRAKKKRSQEANAYFWVLVGKIAAVTGIPRSDIYRHAVKEIGGNSTIICMQQEAADEFCREWARKGEGWQTERIPSKLDGCVNVEVFYGSSTYDTATMARLIDNIVQDAKALDIETLPPDKLDAMMEEWDGRKRVQSKHHAE